MTDDAPDLDYTVPLSNRQAERDLLGMAIAYPESADEILTLAPPELFAEPAHVAIGQRILEMTARGVPSTLTLLANELMDDKATLRVIGGPAGLSMLSSDAPPPVMAQHYARIVTHFAELRSVDRAATRMRQMAHFEDADAAEIVLRARAELDGVQTYAAAPPTPASLLALVVEDLDKPEPPGIRYGYAALDRDGAVDPMQPGHVILIGGRPGAGKSVIGGDIARAAATAGKRVAVWTGEMSAKRWMRRQLAAQAQVPGNALKAGVTLSQAQEGRLARAFNFLADLPIHVDDYRGADLGHLRALVKRTDAELLVVDYLQIMRPPRGNNREQEVAGIAEGIQEMAGNLGIPIVALCQLKRTDQKPKLTDLRESGALEQVADVVLLLHRDDTDADLIGEVEVIVAKQRDGAAGFHERLAAILHTFRFADLAEGI